MPDRRVALVTGGARGIGAAIATRLGRDGLHVIVNYRSSEAAAREVVDEIAAGGGSAELARGDVADLESVRTMFRSIAERHRRLDVLVNNAGRNASGLLVMTPSDEWWALLHDNLAPVVHCSRAAATLMMRNGGGAVVNMASVIGLRGVEGETAYAAAKAAVIGFTRAFAREVVSKGIVVNCVAPGPIATEMYDAVPEAQRAARLSSLPARRIGQPEEVAEVVSMLASGRASFMIGQVVAIDGGITC